MSIVPSCARGTVWPQRPRTWKYAFSGPMVMNQNGLPSQAANRSPSSSVPYFAPCASSRRAARSIASGGRVGSVLSADIGSSWGRSVAAPRALVGTPDFTGASSSSPDRPDDHGVLRPENDLVGEESGLHGEVACCAEQDLPRGPATNRELGGEAGVR